MLNQGVKRHHHILPKLYLKGFVEREGLPYVWEYRRCSSGGPIRKSIGQPCSTLDYYAYIGDDCETDFESVENLLEQLEKPSNAIFKKIRSHQDISRNEKSVFSFYITQMIRRVPRARQRLGNLLPAATAAIEPEVRAKFNLPNTATTEDMLTTIFADTKTSGYHKKLHLDVLKMPLSNRIAETLEAMTWRFFSAPDEHKFLTSDDPVFFDLGLGLKHPYAEVSFPISTDIALVASNWRGAREGFFDAPSQVVKELNRRAIVRSIERVYFHRSADWIMPVFKKSGSDWQTIH
jgi:hypothetical protein